MSFCNLTLRTGRKEHRCKCCSRTIPAGEKSYDVAGLFEGEFFAYRACVPCEQLIKRLLAADALSDEGFLLSEVREAAGEVGEPWPPSLEAPDPQLELRQ